MTKSKQHCEANQNKPQGDSRSGTGFFEIVNWRKAQYKMKAGGGNPWLKLYTSLLEHDGFGGMDDSARMLIVALWLYAARSGLHILPADPEWLKRKIPMLNGTPDLGPLLDAADVYGRPTPFIKYCKPPKVRKGRSAANAPKKAGKSGERADGTEVATRRRASARAHRAREQSRGEEREERTEKPLRVSEEKNRREKKRISAEHRAEQRPAERAAETAEEPEKPVNPMESEAGSAEGHYVPQPARSAYHRSQPQVIGAVVNDWLPEHWQDPRAEQFGWEIVRALGYSDNRHNLKARSEWGAFASWWVKVKGAAPIMMLGELREIAVIKATYVRTKAKSARNRSAVWFHIMAGELSKRGVTLTPPTRASPRQRESGSGAG